MTRDSCLRIITTLLEFFISLSSLLTPTNLRFDCVYPTRVARFGVAIVPSGTMRLKAKEYSKDLLPVEEGCLCSTCRNYTRAFLHTAFKDNNALASQLLTKHNIAHMMTLMRTMRQVRPHPRTIFELYVQD